VKLVPGVPIRRNQQAHRLVRPGPFESWRHGRHTSWLHQRLSGSTGSQARGGVGRTSIYRHAGGTDRIDMDMDMDIST
jgi:hypothetical protein